VTPTNAFVYEVHIITIKAKLSKYSSVIDTTYVFNVHTNLPSIVNPTIISSAPFYALSTCPVNLGNFSVSPSCSGETLSY
jgi:hypothetical protein